MPAPFQAERRAAEKAREDDFRRRMLARLEEEDRLEQMNAQVGWGCVQGGRECAHRKCGQGGVYTAEGCGRFVGREGGREVVVRGGGWGDGPGGARRVSAGNWRT